MREKENYFILLLVVGISALAFLSYDVMVRIAEQKPAEPLFSPLAPRSTASLPLPQNEKEEDFFLPPYKDEELHSFRDVFFASTGVPSQQGEVVVAMEEGGESPNAEIPQEEIQPQEELPQITLKGMVTSAQGVAIVVDVDGKISILTSQKPLQEGIKLVKVEGKQVVLEYQGREFTFSLSD